MLLRTYYHQRKTMNSIINERLTIGDVARELGESKPRVAYALDTYKIEPRERLGIYRVFHRDQLPEIKSALSRIASRRLY